MMLEKIPNERLHHKHALSTLSSLRAFAFFHTLATHTIGPRPPEPDPYTHTQEPGQDSQHRKVQDWIGGTGQGRQGKARHRHNSASSDPHIASAKYRITVSHLPFFRSNRQSCMRRGEARRQA